jgi:hypothetical protein
MNNSLFISKEGLCFVEVSRLILKAVSVHGDKSTMNQEAPEGFEARKARKVQIISPSSKIRNSFIE